MKKEKTTYRFNTQAGRKMNYLLGIILILSFLFTAFEFTSYNNDDTDFNEELIKKPKKDPDLIPAPVPPTMPDVPKPTTEKVITHNVVEVKKQIEHTDKEVVNNNPLLIGNGEAEVKDAKVEKAIPEKPVNADEELSKKLLEELPEFPGGVLAFMKWLTKNLQYPAQAQRKSIMGKVVVSFIVAKDGTIIEPKIETSIHPLLDNEALRVIKMMPKWRPGKAKGKVCETKISIPIVFQI